MKAAAQDRAKQWVLMPGFLSGHSHLASSVSRGINSGRELDGMIDFRPTFMDGRFYEKGDIYAFTCAERSTTFSMA